MRAQRSTIYLRNKRDHKVDMLVAELHEAKRFRITDAPTPEPGPGEIRVRVHAVGICGSDLHNYLEGGIGDTRLPYPAVLGHEPVGEVDRAGAGVSGWQKGDRAFLEPAVYCYHCEYCLSGHHNVCANLEFFSAPPKPGFFREYVNLPVHNVVPCPSELDAGVATLFEPLAVVLHSLKFAVPSLGETVVVFGGGPIGLLTVAALRTSGVGRIWCVEPQPRRRELAMRMGADATIDPRAVDPVKQILHDTGNRGVDMAFDCATKDDSVNQCLDVTRPCGRIVVTGIPSELQVKLNYHTWRRKEQFFYTVRRSNHETAAAVKMLVAEPVRFGELVTHSRSIEQIGEAFEMLERAEEGAGKVVLTF